MKNYTSENHWEFCKLPEWNVHQEIISHIQTIENFRQYLLLRKGILQKTVVGCP